MYASQIDHQLPVVLAKFREHVLSADKLVVVIGNALKPRDVADRMQRRSPDLPDALRYRIGGSEYLITLLIHQQVIVPEVRPRYMPMKILRLDVKGKKIGERHSQCR